MKTKLTCSVLLVCFYYTSFSQVFTYFHENVDSVKSGLNYDKWPQSLVTVIPDKNLNRKLSDFVISNPDKDGIPIFLETKINSTQGSRIVIDGKIITVFRFVSEGAYGISFYFEDFKLADGVELYFYSSDFKQQVGPITSSHNNGEGIIGTDIIYNDVVLAVLIEPLSKRDKSSVHFSRINHWYRGFPGYLDGRTMLEPCNGCSLPCQVNVACPAGSDFQCESNGIALVLHHDLFYCTAALVNTANQSLEPYILTAMHCKATTNPATLFRFFHKGTSCSSTSAGYYFSFNGATLMQNSTVSLDGPAHTDYALGKLNLAYGETKDHLICYGLSYLGWTREHTQLDANNRSTTISNTNLLHHPEGDLMKYTRGSKPVGQTVNGGNPNYFWKSTWNIGLTEIGTSGAPWFDHNRRIIGQHYSGTSNGCESTNFGYAGRFDKSWDVGSYSSGPFANLKLKNILDPNNTNILRTNSVGMCFPIEGTINGALVSTSTNQVAAYQTHTLIITNTPWASNYTFQIISGSNATVTSSGNHCYINVTGYGNFTIRVTVRNARHCTKTRDITFGAYNYLLSSYPNPASDKIVVSLNEKESLDVDQIRLTGLNGVTEIPKFQVIDQNFEIDVTTLPNGLYILEAINGKMIYRKTIMIKR